MEIGKYLSHTSEPVEIDLQLQLEGSLYEAGPRRDRDRISSDLWRA